MTKIICTIGPSSFKKKIILEFKKLGVNLFRINLSHTKLKNLKKNIAFLKKLGIKNICIDTEGAQVRTSIVKKRFLKKNQYLNFNKKNKNSKKNSVGLYPPINFKSLKRNSIVLIGFENLALRIIKNHENNFLAKVISEGYIDSNKGVHFQNHLKLNDLTNKDIKAIEIAKLLKVNYFALSFAKNKKAVLKFRKLIGKKAKLISKIESKSALKNLGGIISSSDKILIDRGDLSRYVPIEKIPIIQKKIIKKAIKSKKEVLVATNLLETMISNKIPTRAESNDIFCTLQDGANGLVLAAETAIGKYPVECVKFIKKSISASKNYLG